MTDSYKVFVKPSVESDLRRIPHPHRKRIDERILSLSANPRPPGCEKLTGIERYRLRQGVYRILYEISDEKREVVVVKVQHRREVYR